MHKYFFKNYYFINKFNKNNIDKLDNNTTVIYRNYNKKVDEIEILKIKSYCHRKKIKFPLNFTIDDLNFGFRVINDEKFNQVKIIDLRIPNKVITDD